MRYDMATIVGTRRPTQDDTSVFLSSDDPVGLSMHEILVDFLHWEEDEDMVVTETLGARLEGTIALGHEIDYSGEDFWEICDAHSGNLEAVARLADKEGVLKDELGGHRPTLFIQRLDLAKEILDAENFAEFFELIPKAVFLLYNVHVDLTCYVIAEREGYYAECAENALLDPRSVDGFSPLIHTDAGFTLNKSGEMLYRLIAY